MASSSPGVDLSLVGIGLYTPAEAGRLLRLRPARLARWLRGHETADGPHDPLWHPQVDLGDGHVYLGFLDLIQARMAASLIAEGLSPQRVRAAILLAADILRSRHPFARAKFRTDGRTLLLQTLQATGDEHLLDLFAGGQYVMRHVIEPSLRGLDFVDDLAARWWPLGRKGGIVIDPARQFGRPIDNETGIPTRILAEAAAAEASPEAAASAYRTTLRTVRRAVSFEQLYAA